MLRVLIESRGPNLQWGAFPYQVIYRCSIRYNKVPNCVSCYQELAQGYEWKACWRCGGRCLPLGVMAWVSFLILMHTTQVFVDIFMLKLSVLYKSRIWQVSFMSKESRRDIKQKAPILTVFRGCLWFPRHEGLLVIDSCRITYPLVECWNLQALYSSSKLQLSFKTAFSGRIETKWL